MTIDPALLGAVERSRAAWPVPGHELPLDTWRERYEALVAAARAPGPGNIERLDRIVGSRAVRVRIYRPSSEIGPLSALVYFHGGGWVIGSIESHDDIIADIAHDSGCLVVSVDYSRAPEHRFPVAFDEGCEVLDWLVAEARTLGVDSERLFVGGDSAGGNLATAIALADSGHERRLAGQVLLYPCVDTDFSRASYRRGVDAPFLSSGEMTWFWDQYAPSPDVRRDPFAVPLRATAGQLSRLPPTFVATAEHDPLFDEGCAFAARLRRAGRPVRHEPGLGMVHGFIRLRRQATEPARIYRAMCDWIRDCPARARSPDEWVE